MIFLLGNCGLILTSVRETGEKSRLRPLSCVVLPDPSRPRSRCYVRAGIGGLALESIACMDGGQH